ncbi:MAG TPA: hypothetical protein PKD05_10995 [Candidatus Melainabacteria bacterium]|nr:hypothetical protein [Candidatus Melainabacteria bacterium]
MENVQSSSQYVHVSDPASLDGLDDFLDGLLDKVFDPILKSAEPEKVVALRPVSKLPTESYVADLDIDDLFDCSPDDIVSGDRGLFSPSYGASTSTRPSLFEADPDQTVELELKIRFLEAQLEYRNRELRESLSRIRFMEGQVTAKDDQLKMVPELIKRGADAVRYEHELEDLKDKLAAVSNDLLESQHVLESLRGNWIGRLSLRMIKDGSK